MFCLLGVSKVLLLQAFIFIVSTLNTQDDAIYVFNTEDNDNVEYYDCVIVDTVPYCRRPASPVPLRRDNQKMVCHHGGANMSFHQLQNKKKSAKNVVQGYRSSMERAEEYALYLANETNSSSLCFCERLTFGKNCEYRLMFDQWSQPFAANRAKQDEKKEKDRLKMQVYQKTLCYETLACDYGLLCLDWRDICDGRQQCMNGTDEETCDLLEFNECERDEYRCSNGMCIPDLYFLDGEYDCMDHSDEQEHSDDQSCAYRSDPFNCDEHLCDVKEWSCGDGQCIDEKNRFDSRKKEDAQSNKCHSMREYLYMCEVHYRQNLWTSDDGRCYDLSNIHLLEDEDKSNKENRTRDEYCLYLLKCILSGNLGKNCSCNWWEYDCYLKENCSSTIQYPTKELLTPYLISYYTADGTWFNDKRPSFYTVLGSIRCRGYQAKTFINQSIRIESTMIGRQIDLENIFCHHPNISRNITGPRIDPLCHANTSYTLGKRLSYAFVNICSRCISQYRINDGIADCLNGEDENRQLNSTCSEQIRRHRFQCSIDENTCLIVKTIGDLIKHCQNGRDEYMSAKDRLLSKINCNQKDLDECSLLRDYISKSSIYVTDNTQTKETTKMSFRFYCDTFLDKKDKSDESKQTCRSWICARNEYQCANGQCIHSKYVCDGEWDCADASDELFGNNHLSEHNQMINISLDSMICAIIMDDTIETSNISCNKSTEYSCLLINFNQLSDILTNRPCINISQIGDHNVDCLGAIDERNTLFYSDGIHQLGFAFQCRSSSNEIIDYNKLCLDTNRCSNRNDDQAVCGERCGNSLNANNFICINGDCILNGRCNGIPECKYGEDEYVCNPLYINFDSKKYRTSKQEERMNGNKYVKLPKYPVQHNRTKRIVKREQNDATVIIGIVETAPSKNELMCNRGVAALNYTNSAVCFCPPSYYGDECEYHSDRLTSYVHLNISHTSYEQTKDINLLLRVLVLLIYENQIIHQQSFDYRPAASDHHRIVKQKHHLIYSREKKLLEEKIRRNWNRSAVIQSFPYSIQYEAYELNNTSEIKLVGVWRYPLFFDFLPSYRFAKILRFHHQQSNSDQSSNAECHILQNDPSKHICLCKSGYSGDNCSIKDSYCSNNYCHSNALCKANYSGVTAGDRLPLCVCPLNRYGRRCALVYDQCDNNPCKNNGTCYPSTDDLTKLYCICSENYHGDRCEKKKASIDLMIMKKNVTGTSVVQYFYIELSRMKLDLAYQKLFDQLPDQLHYRFSKTFAPDIVLMKNYPNSNISSSEIYFLSLSMKANNVNSSINITTENMCINIKDISIRITVNEYHQICRNRTSTENPYCFFDNDYVCFCEEENYRAECFLYDHELDRCDKCLPNGDCIRGNSDIKDEYRCLCHQCRYGRQCQYSSEVFSFTMEQIFFYGLLHPNISIRQMAISSIVIYACLAFILGIFNNLLTFITFYRSKFLRSGVGNYLLVGSVVNQITLFFLAFRLFLVVLGGRGCLTTVNDTFNTILCKFAAYGLSSGCQLSYWLMGTIAIERLYITWRIKGTWLKKSYVARRFIFVLTIVILILNIPQIVFNESKDVSEIGMEGTSCILTFRSSTWTRLNQANSYLSSLIPLVINIICTIGIIFLIIRQKLLANKKITSSVTTIDIETAIELKNIECVIQEQSDNKIDVKEGYFMIIRRRWNFFQSVFRENIELIIGPAITIVPQLFSLPQLIIASILDCHNFTFENPTIRYSFMVSLAVFYLPQSISFFLYVRPSSVYYEHFRSTKIGKQVLLVLGRYRSKKTNQAISATQPSQYKFFDTKNVDEIINSE